MARRKKKKLAQPAAPVDLNVMPFIDIFSLLCTFLLFSASFVTLGLVEVQVPFLSNAAETEKDEDKKVFTINVTATKQILELETGYEDEETKREQFENTEEGRTRLNIALKALQTSNKASDKDKVTLFVDDNVKYQILASIIDSIKLYDPKGPKRFLFKKIVMGSVLLADGNE